MTSPWEADPQASFKRRMVKPVNEMDDCNNNETCPDIWEMDNGDVAVIGRDLTHTYADRLPNGVSVGYDERLVIIPGGMLRAATTDIPDA